MKRCPECGQEYGERDRYCEVDGAVLEQVAEERRDPLVGQVLDGRYRLVEWLGGGAFGQVYRAENLALGGRVEAVKVIGLGSFRDPAAMRKSFLKESALLGHLGNASPYIVQVYNSGVVEQWGLYYLAMEYVPGRSLAELVVTEGPLAPARAVGLLRQLCQALMVAHGFGEGVVHLDLKLDNLLVMGSEGTERLKVLDFGIARVLEEAKAGGQTYEFRPRGTPGYAAPEQMQAGGAVDARTDLFAAGVVLYELLTGHEPWCGKPVPQMLSVDEAWQCVGRPGRLKPISPRRWRPELPPALERVVRRLLEKEPGRRYQSAQELDAALAALSLPPARPVRPEPVPHLQHSVPRSWLKRAAVVGSLAAAVGLLWVVLRPYPRVLAIEVKPEQLVIEQGRNDTLWAFPRDARGRPLALVARTGPHEADLVHDFIGSLRWTTSNPAVATVVAAAEVSAVVSGVAPGTTIVTAASGGLSTTATVTVRPASLAQLEVRPDRSSLEMGQTIRLEAIARDAGGNVLDRPVTWVSSDPAVASVSDGGLVTGLQPGTTTITARVNGERGNTRISVKLLEWREVSDHFGWFYTCAVATNGAVYCWGLNAAGQLGDGSNANHPAPVRVTGGLTFRSVSAGGQHTCGVAAEGAAYCWGANSYGQLGDGGQTDQGTPVRVAGGKLSFQSVSAGAYHTCGVTADGAVYCWGRNDRGQLGNGDNSNHATPGPVTGGLTFRSVSAGGRHTCGVAAEGAAYCWGTNEDGELGDGGPTDQATPVRVAGWGLTFADAERAVRVDGPRLRFQTLSAGDFHTCGVTADGGVYCWGLNFLGPTVRRDPAPVRVTGGPTFRSVSAGSYYTCGVATDGVAYCWGANYSGQFGDGSTTSQVTPVRVAGGLAFRSIGAGSRHTCGVSAERAAYCWGTNEYGQLGDGTAIDRLSPAPVSPPVAPRSSP